MNNKYETRTLSLLVNKKGEPIFSELSTIVAIDDNGAGEFIALTQDDKRLEFDPQEWDAIDSAVRRLIKIGSKNEH